MLNILIILAGIYLVYQAFLYNVIVGVIAFVALVLYIYVLWYSEFCIARAKALYAKDAKAALRWFERAYKRGMKSKQLETYAYYLLREGETEKAEKIYEGLLRQRLTPENRLKVRADYAVFLLKTGRIDEAIEELEEVTVNYNNTTTYGSLGYLYLLKNNRRRAESYNLEAYDYNSSDPVILDNLVQLYIKLEDFEKAKKYADELIERKPYFVEGYYDSAYVYLKLEDFEKAEELLETAKGCRRTFMSTVTEEDLNALCAAISEKRTDIQHKLGVFGDEEEEIEIPKKLTYVEDKEETFDYEEADTAEIDENDPFI